MLDVAILAPASPVAGAWSPSGCSPAAAVTVGTWSGYRGRRVEIRVDADLPREVDGEVISPGRSLTITLRPGALVVRVPVRVRDRLAGELRGSMRKAGAPVPGGG